MRKFLKLKENASLLDDKSAIYFLIDISKIDNKHSLVKIGKVHAILIDRVIFSDTYEYITDKEKEIISNFYEISITEAKKSIDNTKALLSKEIFRR